MHGDTQAFVIRIWQEGSPDGRGDATVWRGSIEHVGDGKRLYFHDIDSVGRFIKNHLGLTTDQSSRWKTLLARVRHESS